MTDWHIRLEAPGEEAEISGLVARAFAPMPFSDGSEVAILEKLRANGDLLLSLVAVEAGKIIGHIAFTPITIDNADLGWVQLAPLAVLPERQRCGVGSALIAEGLAQMRQRGVSGVGVEGDPAYYERFGFTRVEGFAPPGPHAVFYRVLAFKGEIPRGLVGYAPAFD